MHTIPSNVIEDTNICLTYADERIFIFNVLVLPEVWNDDWGSYQRWATCDR